MLLCCKALPTVQCVAHAIYLQSCDRNMSAWQPVHPYDKLPHLQSPFANFSASLPKVSEGLQAADACQEDILLPLKELSADPYLLESP